MELEKIERIKKLKATIYKLVMEKELTDQEGEMVEKIVKRKRYNE